MPSRNAASFPLAVVLAVLGVSFAAGLSDGLLYVTCGSVIKLQSYSGTQHCLHSHDISYGQGSGQQSVTGFAGVDAANSLWRVVGNKQCIQGARIANDELIRLQHLGTRRWLHSHAFASPLSGNQEVSCFGRDAVSDAADLWHVELDGASELWLADAAVRLRHNVSGTYLANHAVAYQRPIAGHTEVFAVKGNANSAQTRWRATQGVFL